jgi:alkylated DNA repair dioxygenase AlkB
MSFADFTNHDLGGGLSFFEGKLPLQLLLTSEQFEEAWNLHPEECPTIFLHGREVAIPRWQQAYGKDYHFSHKVSVALPIPAVLQPLLKWTQETICPELNGLLLNWYEGPGHYIGPHHDSVKDMTSGAPIVTISLGETRKFRLQRLAEKRDFFAKNGTVYVLPQDTNEIWKHGVPKSTRYKGRRISITVRGLLS